MLGWVGTYSGSKKFAHPSWNGFCYIKKKKKPRWIMSEPFPTVLWNHNLYIKVKNSAIFFWWEWKMKMYNNLHKCAHTKLTPYLHHLKKKAKVKKNICHSSSQKRSNSVKLAGDLWCTAFFRSPHRFFGFRSGFVLLKLFFGCFGLIDNRIMN